MKKQKTKKWSGLALFILSILSLTLVFNGSVLEFLKASLFTDYTLEAGKKWSETHPINADIAKFDALSMNCDVVIAGGGSGGAAAAIQSARLGADTCLIEETNWLGGMLTSAGVSAIDGHTDTPSGIFKEFLDKVEAYYKANGKVDQLKKCSVSYFCFEPSVGDIVFKQMVNDLPTLRVFYESKIEAVYRDGNLVTGVRFKIKNTTPVVMKSKVVVDATEFGDLMYLGNVPYDLGIDKDSTEPHADEAEVCIQPLTYVAILKRYDIETPIKRPASYNEDNFKCVVKDIDKCPNSNSKFDLPRLFTYGMLPNDKVMINIPSHSYGNDFHATSSNLEKYTRAEILQMAKNYSQGFIYYLQTNFNLREYGLYNEFGSQDSFAKIPYVRESRRLKGAYRMTENDVISNEDGQTKLFKDSVAIGDYPIDLHFCDYGKGDIFYSVSPYQIPYEVTVPKTIDGFMVAEKNISVSHIVNGTTRLQPVVMAIGQAVGAGAAISVQDNIQPRYINISKLQDILVNQGAQVYYFHDVPAEHYANKYLNKLALKGVVSAYSPVSHMPESYITQSEFFDLLNETYKKFGDKITTPLEKIDLRNYFDEKNDVITRVKLADFISKNIITDWRGTSDVVIKYKDIKPWTLDFYNINKLAVKGIFNSKNLSFRPSDFTTRGEAITIIGRTIDYLEKITVTYSTPDLTGSEQVL
jgi:hypothetical protein